MLGLNATFRDISLNLTTLSAEISRAVCFCAAFRKAGGGRGPSNSSRSPNAPAGRWTPFTRPPSAPSSATRDGEPEVVGGDLDATGDGTERPHDQTVGGPLGDPELVIETAAFRGAPGERHTDDPGAFATPAPCVRERVDGGPVALTVRRRDVVGGKGSREQGPD